MSDQPKRAPFSKRALAAFGVTLGFLTMLVSGVVLTIGPSGRIARETSWQFIGLDRGTWEAIHLGAALWFSLAAVWHLVLHIPIYRNLLGGTRVHPYGNRTEMVLVLGIVVLLIATAILDLPPTSWLVDLNSYFKREFWLA
ncbi:DUF4405 domain-containing protein [Alisedimentitalea sp. MJ-SS2]|uniref:DUF4405 domain-containing protein n=1 Tax=Aliisedimentitalea sp. MJ-SS2 TaxID=3049795 RepID=UPI00291280FC|nr:DUF4405 domain-containing protein [Alisedimentitalea sp. MJ-SS2]MDU8926488.1 DUF4405 domain-containing protein [Alisedimentitalea sp. MJ-SS2]